MAAIDKCCELGGCNYLPAYLRSRQYGMRGYRNPMAGWKRDGLQVCPACRKAFKGAQHTIFITPYSDSFSNDKWRYLLLVDDPELEGQVGGKYVGWTASLPKLYRRLRRYLGPHLNIVREDRHHAASA